MNSVVRKAAALCSVATLSVAFLAGCAGGSDKDAGVDPATVKDGKVEGQITFQTWSLKNDRFTPYFENLIKDFEKQNPKVTVKWMDQPGDGYADKLLQQANAGELPDVVNVPPEYALTLAHANKLLDLKKADDKALDSYVDGGLKAYQYHGLDGTYAYPWYLGVVTNYWNKDALTKAGLDPNKPPTNDDEYLKQAAQAADKNVALLNTVPNVGFFASRGIKIFDEQKRQFTFANADSEKLLKEWVDLYQKGAMPAELLSSVDNGQPANEAFYKGTLANIQSTPSFAASLKTDAPTLLDKVSVTEPWETPQLLAQGIAVSANSKHAAAALAFAQFVTNNENQVNFVKEAKGFLPGTKAGNKNPEDFIASDDTPLMKEAVKASAKTIQRAKLLYPLEMSNDMKTAVQQEMALAMQGKKDPKAALEDAQKKCNDMMKDIDS